MEKGFRSFIIIMVLISFVGGILFFAGCSKKGVEEYRIGAILPLTGDAAAFGEYIKNSVTIVTDEVNANGGIKGKKINVIYQDSKNEPKEAISAFNVLTSVDKVPIIISASSGPSMAIAPLADKSKVVLFASVTAVPGITDQSQWVFRCHPTADNQANTMASFARKKLGVKTAAILYLNDEYGKGSFNVFKKDFEALGGKIIWAESYEKTGKDFKTLLIKLKSQSPESVWVTGYGPAFSLIMKQTGEVGISTTILSDLSLSTPAVLKQVGSAANGAYLVMTSFNPNDTTNPKVKLFVDTYKQKYGDTPPFFSAIGYDIANMIYNTIEKMGYSADSIRQGLTQIKDFPGVMGNMTILPNRETTFPLKVKRVQDGKIVDVVN